MAEPIDADDVLVFEPRKVVSYLQARADGACVLRVAYGDKVIEFEGDLLPVGQRIFQSGRFRAGEVAACPDGQAKPWGQVSELLQSLLTEGVLRREAAPGSAPGSVPGSAPEDRFPPPGLNTDPRAPMPPLPWRSLADLCEFASARLGHAVRPDVAETSLGARMITQVLRDDEGRQGGENGLAMVTPMLTDAVPTEWRRCRYRGSRFGDPRPMNVSALRQLQRHLPDVLAVTSAVRQRYLQRSGLRRLDLGHLCTLAEVLNVLPAWLLVRPRAPIASGEQPAWVHSLAKTVAGIDMSLRYLVDESEEHTLDSPVTAADIHRAAEFSGAFASATGVCSGSAAMIDRADRAFTGEDAVEGGEARLATCCAIDEFLDYGLAWCRLSSARFIGDCLALGTVEAGLASDPLGGEDPRQVAFLDVLQLERAALDRPEGSLERRVAMLRRRFRDAGGLLATHTPEVPEGIFTDARPEDTAASLSGLIEAEVARSAWAPVLQDVLATERRTLALLRDLQQQLNTRIGRVSVASVERSDVAAARRLRGRDLLSERVATLLGPTVHGQGERGLVVGGRGGADAVSERR